MLAHLRDSLGPVAGVVDVRGMGLMLGIELDRPCGALVARGLEAGLLINVTQERVVRLLPPLILRQEEAERLVALLVPLVRAFLAAEPVAG